MSWNSSAAQTGGGGCCHPTQCVFVVVFVSTDLQLDVEVGVSLAATLVALCSPLFKWQLHSITVNGKQSVGPTRPQSFPPTQWVSVCVAPSNTHTHTSDSRSKKSFLFFFLPGWMKALQWHIFHKIIEGEKMFFSSHHLSDSECLSLCGSRGDTCNQSHSHLTLWFL